MNVESPVTAPAAPNDPARDNLRTMVRGAYDIQKLRIQMGNRIVGTFKVKLGQAPGQSEETIDAEGKEILDKLRKHYNLLTDGVVKFPTRAKFQADGVIDTYTELCLIAEYVELEAQEKKHFRRLTSVLEDFPIYNEFLEPTKGIGPAMAGVLISEINIHKARHPSSLWKYAGLDCAPDGQGRSRRAEHLVKREYVNKDGEAAERNSITFNPWLKTKILGVCAGSFLKASPNPYRDIYDGYKNRLENHPVHMTKTKGHRHAMAMRYMMKMFLVQLYTKWRALEGLPVSLPYSAAKLGLQHPPMPAPKPTPPAPEADSAPAAKPAKSAKSATKPAPKPKRKKKGDGDDYAPWASA